MYALVCSGVSVYVLCFLMLSFSDSNCHLRLHSRNSTNGGDYINASFIDVSTPHSVSTILYAVLFIIFKSFKNRAVFLYSFINYRFPFSTIITTPL